MRDTLNLLEADRLYPNKKRGSDFDYDQTTLQALERQVASHHAASDRRVRGGPSLEDQKAEQAASQQRVQQKRLERYKAAHGISTEVNPNPTGKFDWTAVFENKPEFIGRGDTETEAIQDLMRELEARHGSLFQPAMPRPLF
jgi:hypothetical protein